jgi:hypothetical protein
VPVISATVVTASVVARPITPVIRAVPGSSADEHSTYEVVRTVVAVRRTGIRIIGVVPVRTNGWRPKVVVIVISGPNLNSDRNLRLR